MYGGSIADAVLYELEKLRCNGCLEIFTAPLPDKAGKNKYTPSFNAALAVNHYMLGMPFYRLQQYHKNIGIPLAASNQFACMETLLGAALPVYNEYLRQAGNADMHYIDDTKVFIQSLFMENKTAARASRVGMFSTGIIAQLEKNNIYIIATGRNHAGENISEILKKRQVVSKSILMCDALSRNVSINTEIKRLLIICFCLVHARRNFYECYDDYPELCEFVLESFAKIYINDAYCKQQKFNKHQRLQYHREHSRPVMKELYRRCCQQLDEKLIEPNSSIGDAIKYLIKHRRQLTRFLRIPGAPLDNNSCERLIKRVITYRKNSLRYRNLYGAFVGDVLMTLIFTAHQAEINPTSYLTALQENSAVIKRNPELWMPWNYQDNLEQQQSLAA